MLERKLLSEFKLREIVTGDSGERHGDPTQASKNGLYLSRSKRQAGASFNISARGGNVARLYYDIRNERWVLEEIMGDYSDKLRDAAGKIEKESPQPNSLLYLSIN